jgi:hypothetical protein
MRAALAPSATALLVALAILTVSCAPPPGPEPSPTSQGDQAHIPRDPLPPGTPRSDGARDLEILPLPSQTPVTVYTRTAPTSLVDERGTPLQVLTGHHTRLELLHTYKDRAQVACRLCPTPAEGWIQANMIMPADHEPSEAERGDDRLDLALFVAQLRRTLAAEGTFPELTPTDEQRELLLRLMDQGFALQDREALAPASAGAYAREGASIRLRRGPDGWRVKAVELPAASPEAEQAAVDIGVSAPE